jgi:glycosyltransferase involved in cell wall biosynthesis
MDLSIVIPVYNEEESLAPLHAEIAEAMGGIDGGRKTWEIVLVDDGSSDRSREVIRSLADRDPHVRGVFFRRNFGQTAAMAAGADYAEGDVVIFMDADRQNDPADIGRLLAEIAKGSDVVCGWRKDRKDNALTRKVPSKIANWLIRKVGGVQIHDLGCSLKAFRSEVIKEVKLYGEMHRFIPIYANAVGASITEIVVNHRPRTAGTTKYGLSRTFHVILDLITVKYLMTYFSRPMHFFGAASFLMLLGAGASGTAMLVNKLVYGVSMIRSPLLLLSAVLLMLAVNFVLMGLLAEVMSRIYFEGQKKADHKVKEVIRQAKLPRAAS